MTIIKAYPLMPGMLDHFDLHTILVTTTFVQYALCAYLNIKSSIQDCFMTLLVNYYIVVCSSIYYGLERTLRCSALVMRTRIYDYGALVKHISLCDSASLNNYTSRYNDSVLVKH